MQIVVWALPPVGIVVFHVRFKRGHCMVLTDDVVGTAAMEQIVPPDLALDFCNPTHAFFKFLYLLGVGCKSHYESQEVFEAI